MNRFDIAKKFLITDNEENIKKIEEYALNLDDRSYINLVCEIYLAFTKERGEGVYKEFSDIPDIEKFSDTEKEKFPSYKDKVDLIRSLKLEDNEGWDIYREEYFINFIKSIYIKLSEQDKIDFIKLIDTYNLYIKNELDYFDVNLMQFFNFPNFKSSEFHKEKQSIFYIQLEKFVISNSTRIIQCDIMDKYFSFGSFRVDEKKLSNIDCGEKTFLILFSGKIINDNKLDSNCKKELIEKLLRFYADYKFEIDRKEDEFFLENENHFVRSAFFEVFQNNKGSMTFYKPSNHFTMDKALKAKMKRIIHSV